LHCDGSRWRGNVKGFGDSFLGAFGGAFGFEGEGEKPASETDPLVPPLSLTGQPPALGFPQLNANLLATQGTLQGINNFFSNIFSGAIFNPSAFNPASSFTTSAITTRISQSVGGTNQPSNVGGTQFGGFVSANEQEVALQTAIVESISNNPSFFLR